MLKVCRLTGCSSLVVDAIADVQVICAYHYFCYHSLAQSRTHVGESVCHYGADASITLRNMVLDYNAGCAAISSLLPAEAQGAGPGQFHMDDYITHVTVPHPFEPQAAATQRVILLVMCTCLQHSCELMCCHCFSLLSCCASLHFWSLTTLYCILHRKMCSRATRQPPDACPFAGCQLQHPLQ